MREEFVAKALRVILYVLLAGGVLVTVTLPWMIDYYMIVFYDAYSILPDYRSFIVIFLMLAGVLGLWIIFDLILMLRTIKTGPFVPRNAKALRRIGVVSTIAAMLFFAKCFVYVTILTLLGGMLLLICGMAAFTLASLFRQAIAYKEENDLTI